MNITGNAYYDFCEMVRKSWTFEKMSEDEKARCWDALHFPVEQGLIKGCYKVRYGIFHAIYNSFLSGIGYDGITWRQPEDVPLF